MILTTAQTAALAAELAVMAVALCLTVVALIRDGGRPPGRHAAPPTPPAPAPAPDPVPEPDPGPRRLAADWRQQVVLPPDPVLVRPYVALLGTGAAR